MLSLCACSPTNCKERCLSVGLMGIDGADSRKDQGGVLQLFCQHFSLVPLTQLLWAVSMCRWPWVCVSARLWVAATSPHSRDPLTNSTTNLYTWDHVHANQLIFYKEMETVFVPLIIFFLP